MRAVPDILCSHPHTIKIQLLQKKTTPMSLRQSLERGSTEAFSLAPVFPFFSKVPYLSYPESGQKGPHQGRSAPAQNLQFRSTSCSGQIQTVPLEVKPPASVSPRPTASSSGSLEYSRVYKRQRRSETRQRRGRQARSEGL